MKRYGCSTNGQWYIEIMDRYQRYIAATTNPTYDEIEYVARPQLLEPQKQLNSPDFWTDKNDTFEVIEV